MAKKCAKLRERIVKKCCGIKKVGALRQKVGLQKNV